MQNESTLRLSRLADKPLAVLTELAIHCVDEVINDKKH